MNNGIIFSMGIHTYIAKIKWIDKEGYYFVEFPALKGCITYGHTFEEAVYMAKDVLSLYLECLKDEGVKLPVEKRSLLNKKSKILNIPVSVPA